MSVLRALRAADYRRTRWKNGGGWTTELARDGDDADFRWRISIAEIGSDGPFSEFPGVARDLLLLEGAGLELDIEGAPPLRLTRRFEHAHFAGEARVQCRLLGGPTRDFNVMVRRDAVCSEVVARPLVGPMMLFPEAGVEWFVHAFSGHANARATGNESALESGDSLHVDFRNGGGSRVLLEGAGELILVKLLPATG